MRITATVNGTTRQADDVWPGESLLFVLRERMGLPGAKNACEQGECGSCTVYLDGTPVCACLVAAGQADGREVVTVEGLAGERRAGGAPGEHSAGGAPGEHSAGGAPGEHGAGGAPGEHGAGGAPGEHGELHPVQQAFIDAGAVQCGFCTPGLLIAAHDLLARDPDPADADVREALAGNLCRCTGYEAIRAAVRLAAERLAAGRLMSGEDR